MFPATASKIASHQDLFSQKIDSPPHFPLILLPCLESVPASVHSPDAEKKVPRKTAEDLLEHFARIF